jgi:hypothetical protein
MCKKSSIFSKLKATSLCLKHTLLLFYFSESEYVYMDGLRPSQSWQGPGSIDLGIFSLL